MKENTTMKTNSTKDRFPESISMVPAASDVTVEHKQLTEDGPGRTEGMIITPFRKFLKNLWGSIHG